MLEKIEKTVTVCGSHQQYLVPMISTFKYKGSELWCPFCGRTAGLFDYSVIEVEETAALKKRGKAFEKATKRFLTEETPIAWKYNQEAETLREYE